MRNGESDRALSAFQQAQKVNPQNPAPHINIASVYVFKKKYPEALKEYEQALTLDPNRIDALGSMMQVYLLQGIPSRLRSVLKHIWLRQKTKPASTSFWGN